MRSRCCSPCHTHEQTHTHTHTRIHAYTTQVSLDGEAIRNEKVKVLQSMSNVTLDDVTLGQYRARWVLVGHRNGAHVVADV